MGIQLPVPQTDPVAAGCDQLYTQIRYNLANLNRILDYGSTLVWNNPSGATPQQVVSTMGQNATAIFTLSGILCNMLSAVSGTPVPDPMPVGWIATPQKDGSLILTPPSV